MRSAAWALVLLATGACRTADSADQATAPAGLGVERVVHGLDHPVHLTAPAGDARLFIVEQPGRIRIVKAGRLLPRPFLDLTDLVGYGGERGLLSVAFHPRYASNGRFYVNYTDRDGDTRVERYHVGSDPDRADKATRALVLRIEQPYANHNGGHIVFAPDGMLWVGMGDGGSGGDPHGNGQNRATLLGKMLRIDVDRGTPYAIPRDNPYADGRAGRPEIWASGLRNPWRFAFDRATGLVYIADVGQNRWEEVDVAPANAPGLDYGWNLREGAHPFARRGGGSADAGDAASARRVEPAYAYDHDAGCSVTGGFVYRGRAIPELVGHYLFGDYCEGWIRSFRWDGHEAVDVRRWPVDDLGAITSFGEDAAGEAYVLLEHGSVLRLVKRP